MSLCAKSGHSNVGNCDVCKELIAEYNAAGTMLKRYVHGIGSDDPLVSYDGSGTTSPTYLLADERGSIMAETNSVGTVTTKHQYGPYGEPINQSASRFRYTGQILLPGTELYHYKARVYHPKLGRFLQTDPIGYKDGMNWYAYVGNDPMNAVDPDGTDAVGIVFPDYKISVAGMQTGYLGHAGLLNINPSNGLTRYYEYGRYGNDGMVRNIRLNNNVVFSNGAPTSESLGKVFAEISSKSGRGGPIEAAYFSEASFSSIESFAKPLVGLTNDGGGYGDWSIYKNCASFMQDSLESGGIDTPMMIDPRPNSYIGELQSAKGAKSMSYSGGVFRVNGRIDSLKLDKKIK